jgi:hypothetical protein
LADSVPPTSSSSAIIINFTVFGFSILYVVVSFGVTTGISTLRARRVLYVVVILDESHQASGISAPIPSADRRPCGGFVTTYRPRTPPNALIYSRRKSHPPDKSGPWCSPRPLDSLMVGSFVAPLAGRG